MGVKLTRAELAGLPPELRALLKAELAAGNAVIEVGHTHPAPPFGAFFRLERAVTTRPRASGHGLRYEWHDGSLCGGAFSDNVGHFFVLEPPGSPPEAPDAGALRPGRAAAAGPAAPDASADRLAAGAAPDSPLGRFAASMVMNYEKWHDGIGYDLEALEAAAPAERAAIEALVLAHSPRDTNDVEALARLNTPRARAALGHAFRAGDARVRASVLREAPALIPEAERTAALVHALETAVVYGGLTQMLDLVEAYHPPEVLAALLRGALHREGDVAVHCAALLAFLHGRAAAPFDMALRPFFLRFTTADREERAAAFRELCARIGVPPEPYLPGSR